MPYVRVGYGQVPAVVPALPQRAPLTVSVDLLKFKYDYVDEGVNALDAWVQAHENELGILEVLQWKRWASAFKRFYADTRSWMSATVTDWMALDLWDKDLLGWRELFRRVAKSDPPVLISSDEAAAASGANTNLLREASFPLGMLLGGFILSQVF